MLSDGLANVELSHQMSPAATIAAAPRIKPSRGRDQNVVGRARGPRVRGMEAASLTSRTSPAICKQEQEITRRLETAVAPPAAWPSASHYEFQPRDANSIQNHSTSAGRSRLCTRRCAWRLRSNPGLRPIRGINSTRRNATRVVGIWTTADQRNRNQRHR